MSLIKKTSFWVVLGLLSASVSTAEVFESGAIHEAIPDGSELGLSDIINVSGMTGGITNISVSLAISGTGYGAYNGDFYAYIRRGDLFAILLNRIGKTAENALGSWDDGFNITLTLDDADIHTSTVPDGGVLSGIWGADGRDTSPYTVLDTDPRSALLDQFLTADANGEWTLFVADVESGGTAQLDSWGINVQTVPEPAVMGLITISGGFMLIFRRIFKG
jgi:hypothetical protein